MCCRPGSVAVALWPNGYVRVSALGRSRFCNTPSTRIGSVFPSFDQASLASPQTKFASEIQIRGHCRSVWIGPIFAVRAANTGDKNIAAPDDNWLHATATRRCLNFKTTQIGRR